MAKVAMIPKHVSLTMLPDEAFDLIMTLRSVERELEDVPESIPALRQALEGAYDGDLPVVASEDDGGAAVA